MDKNLFLAIALSVLIYVGWFSFMEKRYGHQRPGAQRPVPAATQAPGAAPGGTLGAAPSRGEGGEPGQSPIGSPGSGTAPAAASGPGLTGAVAFKAGTLEYSVQPMGASIVSYKYPGPLGPVELVEDPSPGFFAAWPDVRFAQAGDGPVFEGVLPSGVRVRKQFSIPGPGEMGAVKLTFTNPGKTAVTVTDWALDVGPGLGTVRSEQKENATLWKSLADVPPPAGKTQDVLTEFTPTEDVVKGGPPWRWVGVNNRYFLAAMFPPQDAFSGYSHGAKLWKTVSGFLGREKKLYAPWMEADGAALTVPPGGSRTVEVPFYFGPKGYTRLRAMGLGLERSVQFGWFHRLGRFTLRVLEFFHRGTGNWGWSIILLTVCLQVVMFPLTYKQMKSMAIMKRIQPEIAKIQKKFANDQRRLQVEMMEVYKKHGANPLGGCLPMVIQLPIFVALFNMLRGAWELHGAPWILWVHDLSAHDPYYILPLIMGGIMFVQNRLNPSPSTDPVQAKMMTYLPLIFTFMFLNFPSGLVLYWLTNSILSLSQQLVIKRRMDDLAAGG